jgi:hypothetical protein
MVGSAGQLRVQEDFLARFFRFRLPEIDERSHIGDILANIDSVIDQQKQHTAILKNVKHQLLKELL